MRPPKSQAEVSSLQLATSKLRLGPSESACSRGVHKAVAVAAAGMVATSDDPNEANSEAVGGSCRAAPLSLGARWLRGRGEGGFGDSCDGAACMDMNADVESIRGIDVLHAKGNGGNSGGGVNDSRCALARDIRPNREASGRLGALGADVGGNLCIWFLCTAKIKSIAKWDEQQQEG